MSNLVFLRKLGLEPPESGGQVLDGYSMTRYDTPWQADNNLVKNHKGSREIQILYVDYVIIHTMASGVESKR